jgi:hypothetical protein
MFPSWSRGQAIIPPHGCILGGVENETPPCYQIAVGAVDVVNRK